MFDLHWRLCATCAQCLRRPGKKDCRPDCSEMGFVVLICISPMAGEVEYLFIFLLGVRSLFPLSLKKYLFILVACLLTKRVVNLFA